MHLRAKVYRSLKRVALINGPGLYMLLWTACSSPSLSPPIPTQLPDWPPIIMITFLAQNGKNGLNYLIVGRSPNLINLENVVFVLLAEFSYRFSKKKSYYLK